MLYTTVSCSVVASFLVSIMCRLKLFHFQQAFEEYISQHKGTQDRLAELKKMVEDFAAKYPMPGFEDH